MRQQASGNQMRQRPVGWLRRHWRRHSSASTSSDELSAGDGTRNASTSSNSELSGAGAASASGDGTRVQAPTAIGYASAGSDGTRTAIRLPCDQHRQSAGSAVRRHSIAVRSAAPVSGQLMCWRLAGWCVRLQCHRRAATRMRWQRAAATARRIRLPCDQQRQSVGSGCAGGLLVGAFDCSAIGGAHAAWRLDAARRHSIAVQSAAAVGGQQICRRPAGAARLAGWRVRF